MDKQNLSRRKILSSIVAAGGAGALVGRATTGLFTDNEVLTNNAIEASANIAGVVDLHISIENIETGSSGVIYEIELPQKTDSFGNVENTDPDFGNTGNTENNNPAYVWVRTTDCPGDSTSFGNNDQLKLADALTVTLKVECSGTNSTHEMKSGSLLDVLNDLRSGELLLCFDGDEKQCLQPGESLKLIFEVTNVNDDSLPTNTLDFGLEFYAEQCRYNAGAENPFEPDDLIEECDAPSKKGISFIAFCSSETDVDLDPKITAINTRDDDGTPTSVDWTTDADVDFVVVKAGTNFTIYDYTGENQDTSGTATSGDSGAFFTGPIDSANCPDSGSSQPESCPCQAAVEKVLGNSQTFTGTSVKLQEDQGELEP